MEYVIKPLSEQEEDIIFKNIAQYADSMANSPIKTEKQSLVFKVENENEKLIGGCVINIHEWGRAVLAKLWVDENYRGKGLGSALIRTAETAAKEKNCYYLCLGTVDFMAKPLYEKHGFKIFTVNHDVPRGHESWSMCKRLDLNSESYIPRCTEAANKYEIKPGDESDSEIIAQGLENYCRLYIAEGHEYVSLNKKLVDNQGKTIAAIVAGVDGDDNAYIEGIWVHETYRNKGLGSYLIAEVEREAKVAGAYVIMSHCCDWVLDFFSKNGYTVRGELTDYPKGKRAYETEKRL